MIAEIIKEVYRDEPEKNIIDLLEEPKICGNLFRSFDDFTQHLIFLMLSQQGTLSRKRVIDSMVSSPYMEEGKQRLSSSITNLSSVKVITANYEEIRLNTRFASNLNEFILAKQLQRGEYYERQDESFFNLLLLLNENNQILRQCRIGSMNQEPTLSKYNFDFIRLPIGYKISILIKGYLKSKKNQTDRKKALKNILFLSELDINRMYKIPSGSNLILEFQKLHLVRRVSESQFIISPYLQHFAFEQKKNTKLLECSIIVETNFKVYVQIPKTNNKANYRLVRQIMRQLIQIDHEDFQLQELIVGQIKQHIMRPLFLENITVQDYLSFFFQFMQGDLKIQKDLGKWNKINFLGLEGPEQEMMIPNNVKQELKLWQTVSRSSNPQFYVGGSDRNSDPQSN